MYSYEILIALLIIWVVFDFYISKYFANKVSDDALDDYKYHCDYRNKKFNSIRNLALYVKENYTDLLKFIFGLIIYTIVSIYLFIFIHYVTYLIIEIFGINGSKIELEESKQFAIYLVIFLSLLFMHCLIVLIYFIKKYRNF